MRAEQIRGMIGQSLIHHGEEGALSPSDNESVPEGF